MGIYCRFICLWVYIVDLFAYSWCYASTQKHFFFSFFSFLNHMLIVTEYCQQNKDVRNMYELF